MFQVFNMSATKATQGGSVQLEYSNMYLALEMAKIATGGFSHTSIDVTQCLVNKQHTKFREVQKWGIAFAGDTMLKAAIERHPAMLRHNKMNRFFSRQRVTAKNQQTCWRCHSAGAFLPNRHRLPSPDPL
jgi:hypothetical protein